LIVEGTETTTARWLVDRLAAGFLLCLMVIGSFGLWIGVPAACLAATAKLSSSAAEHFLIDLPVTIGAMIAWGAFLVWLNGLYLRVTGVAARYDAEEEEYGPGSGPRFLRGPMEPILLSSLVIALVTLTVWFFVFAHGDPGISVAP
jgi:hypothetical protein